MCEKYISTVFGRNLMLRRNNIMKELDTHLFSHTLVRSREHPHHCRFHLPHDEHVLLLPPISRALVLPVKVPYELSQSQSHLGPSQRLAQAVPRAVRERLEGLGFMGNHLDTSLLPRNPAFWDERVGLGEIQRRSEDGEVRDTDRSLEMKRMLVGIVTRTRPYLFYVDGPL